MARPQAADYEQRREAIVAKAAELFAQHGFKGASVADLALACDTSKSLIYHYYPSKEDILYAVMASHIDLLIEDVAVAMDDGVSTESLRALIGRFMRHYVGAADRQKVLLNELDNLPADKREVIVGKQRQVVHAVERQVCRVRPELATDPAHARVVTMLLFGMINWTHTWFRPDGAIRVDELADMATNLFLGSR